MIPRLLCTALLLTVALSSTHSQVPGDVTLEPLAGISNLNGALGLKHADDGSGRRFVVQQNGTVRVIAADDSLLATPFIDIGPLLTSGGEQGLLDLAFHPEYALAGAPGEGLFYLHFSSVGEDQVADTEQGDTVVAEFRVSSDDPNVANPELERVMLTVTQDFGNHNGGQMKFGPDGYLYLALGDGGSGGDPCERAQTLDPAALVDPTSCGSSAPLDDSLALLGKILRIDVDTPTPPGANNLCAGDADGSANYAVPSDNPFAGKADRCGEVFVYGLRNPWRFSFDRELGDLWIGDVGQGQWEEIDLLEAPQAGGENLGWDCYEASSVFESAGCSDQESLTFPVLEYPRQSPDCSVTGGYRYRGPVSGLLGLYVYGDYCSGDVRVATDASGDWQATVIGRFDTGFGLRSFGEDEVGNLYAVASGRIYRFEGLLEVLFDSGFEG